MGDKGDDKGRIKLDFLILFLMIVFNILNSQGRDFLAFHNVISAFENLYVPQYMVSSRYYRKLANVTYSYRQSSLLKVTAILSVLAVSLPAR